MIKSVSISNFKAFGSEHTVNFSNLTLLSGLNSSGKSSIYQVLLLLSQSIQASRNEIFGELPILTLNGDLIQMGKKEEILNDAKNKNVKFGITWSNGSAMNLTFTLHRQEINNAPTEDFYLTELEYHNSEKKNGYELCFCLTDQRWSIKANSVLEFSSRAFQRIFDKHIHEVTKDTPDDDLYNPTVNFKNITDVTFLGFDVMNFKISNDDALECILPKHRSKFNFERFKALYKEDNAEDYEDKSVLLENNYKISDVNMLFFRRKVKYIPPFRGYPRRFYTEGSANNPLIDFNKNKNEIIQYRYDFLEGKILSATLGEALNYWIVDEFKFAEGIIVEEIIPDYASEIFLMKSGKKIPINNVGFGVSQILPVVYNILESNTSKIFIVDEPEVHLHPQLQSKLANFFIQMAKTGKIIIIETHSEYLINALIFYIVKYPELKDNIKMYWVENSANTAVTNEVQFDELGFLNNAPDGFLSENDVTINKLNDFRVTQLNKKNE